MLARRTHQRDLAQSLSQIAHVPSLSRSTPQPAPRALAPRSLLPRAIPPGAQVLPPSQSKPRPHLPPDGALHTAPVFQRHRTLQLRPQAPVSGLLPILVPHRRSRELVSVLPPLLVLLSFCKRLSRNFATFCSCQRRTISQLLDYRTKGRVRGLAEVKKLLR